MNDKQIIASANRHSRHCRRVASTLSTPLPACHSFWCCKIRHLRAFRHTRSSGMHRASTQGDMFRISTIDTPRERRLVVEGTLVQPWVVELRRTWNEAGNSLDGRRVVIDLTNVTTIGAEGKAAIFDLMKEGAKFCCTDVLTKHVLKQLAHRCHTRLHEILNRTHSRNGEIHRRRDE